MQKTILIFTISIFLLLGCGSKKIDTSGSAKELYDEAVTELFTKKGGFPWIFRGTNYEKVFDLLKEIQLRYTFSPFATLAEIRTADAYFKKEEYEQAITEYEEFIKNHPGHNEVSYATYQLALSNYKLRKSEDRDPTYSREALKWFNIFIEKYPDSELVDDAKKRILKVRKLLAKREIYIGKFYLKEKNYKAASERFKRVVDKYSDTKYSDEAARLLDKALSKEKSRS